MSSIKSYINLNNKYDRIVVLIDMDCFYCQVEERLNEELCGKPIAVVQYNAWKGGGIIAVNYVARARGVTRHMRGEDAKEHCPEIELVSVPSVRGKADLTKYRDAGKRVATVLHKFTTLLERASVDEAYLDITEAVLDRLQDLNNGKYQLLPEKLSSTYAVGYDTIGDFIKGIGSESEDSSFSQIENELDDESVLAFKKSDLKLLIGATIVNEIRAAVKSETGYDCSAGIAHNKILAKLTCGFNKPNKQTIMPLKSVHGMFTTLPINKVKGLGGKMGEILCEKLKVKFMGDLLNFSESTLQKHLEEKNGSWLYLMARGIDLEAVTQRMASKSIGCCKKFPGRNSITATDTLNHWLNELASEIFERLEKDAMENNRTAKQMTVSYSQQIGNEDISSSRSVPLVANDIERIAKDALETIKKNTEHFFKADSSTLLNNPIKFLGISVGKFENQPDSSKVNQLQQLFSNHTRRSKEGASESQAEPVSVKTVASNDEKGKIKSFFQNHVKKSTSEPNDATIIETPKNPSATETSIPDAEISQNENKVQTKKNIPQNSFFKNLFDKKLQEKPPPHSDEIISETVSTESEDSEIIPESPIKEPIKPEPRRSFFRNAIVKKDEAAPKTEVVDIIETKTNAIDESVDHLPQIVDDEKPTCSKYETPIIEKETEVKEHYKSTYAEFYYDNPIERKSSVCSKCTKKIPDDEMISHMDFHLAFELSDQQRNDFRKEIKLKINTTTSSTSAKPKITGKQIPSTPITSFLVKNSVGDERVLDARSENEAAVKCEECGKLISSSNLAEHKDYHAARKLHLEINNVSASKPLSSAGSGQSTVARGKRKRPGSSSSEKSNPVKIKSVATFFKA